MDGIIPEAKEMTGAGAIGTAKAVYTPVCHSTYGLGQAVLQIGCRTDRNGRYDSCSLAQVINVPVQVLTLALATHSSSATISTGVGSVLHKVLPLLQPDHG